MKRISGGHGHPEREWTEAKRLAFLAELSVTCNVRASCRAAGLPVRSAYSLRLRDDAFAAEWRAALLAGYDRLEEQLLASAGATIAAEESEGDAEAKRAPFDLELAMRMLERHKRSLDKPAGGRNGQVTRTTRAEAEAALHAKLDLLEQRRRKRK